MDLAVQAPQAGSYRIADTGGPFWSMRPDDGAQVAFDHKVADPLTVTLTAEAGGQPAASREISLTFGDPGVTRTRVTDGGLVGRLFCPATAGPHPGVVMFAGSDAASLDPAAALLASHGFAVLFLVYFGLPGVPRTLQHIELGYVVRALDWLAARPDLDSSKIAVVGLSRGAELALQVGALDTRVRAVVAGSPSSVRHAGISANFADFSQPAWVHGGTPLPFVPGGLTLTSAVSFSAARALRRPLRTRRLFKQSLSGRVADAAAIEVERTQGPIMLVAGADDGMWPAAAYAERIMERLSRLRHGYSDECHVYEGAGHFVCFPYAIPLLPPLTVLSLGGGMRLDFGGSACANALAARDAWRHILRFLRASLSG